MKSISSFSILESKIAKKWLIYVLLGVFSGLGAIFLYTLINFFSVYLLNHVAGFPFKFPTNEKPLFALKNEPFKSFLFLMIIVLGGFFSGLILHVFNDKKSGVNKIIKYFHHKVTTMYFYKPLELLSYSVLAVAIAIGAILFIYLFKHIKLLTSMVNYPIYIKTALGGLVVGLFGIFLPASAGMGYGLLEAAFSRPAKLFLFANGRYFEDVYYFSISW
ncbi:MAG TPA: hypothetical protein ENM99_01970 [Desulfurella acetivorans]|uniref:Chloride channel protein n=1 Tax=Desulfurella acetivorans TaxID=33002 RepID=A0A7C6EB57_DESAE|nr:hypothetical protein [Desulfurella acetivorans]